MKKIISLFILIILFAACKKTVNDPLVAGGDGHMGDGYIIEIRSMRNLDCGVPEVSFSTGIAEVKQLLNSPVNIYVATGLPKVNYPTGTRLAVKIKKPEAADAIVCLTMGPAYRQVVITEVK